MPLAPSRALVVLLLVAGCSFDIPPNAVLCAPPCAVDGAAGGGPDQAGPDPVATLSLQVQVSGMGPAGRLSITLFGPGDSPTTLRRAGAPRPLLLLSPGVTIPREQYSRLAARLSSHGILTAVQSPRIEWSNDDYREDSAALLRWLAAPVGEGAEAVRGMVDPTRVGLAGHGLGGKIALLLAARERGADDVPIRAVMAVDPVDSPGLGDPIPLLTEISRVHLPAGVPLGLLGEGTGAHSAGPCPQEGKDAASLFTLAPAPAFVIRFTAGGYGDFVDDPASCAACAACPAGGAPRLVRDLSWKYLVAYFLYTLGGQGAMADYLLGPPFQEDVKTMRGALVREMK